MSYHIELTPTGDRIKVLNFTETTGWINFETDQSRLDYLTLLEESRKIYEESKKRMAENLEDLETWYKNKEMR